MPTKQDPLQSFIFEWLPGTGSSDFAIENLRGYFPRRPAEAPGEAWFMSKERKFYTQFVEQPMENVPLTVINEYLFDMTSGLDCFPLMVEETHLWISWFKYMLPFLVLRAHERYTHFLIEGLITTFIRVYADRIDDQYSGFRIDALETVGKALMKPEFWKEDETGEIPLSRDDWLTCKGTLQSAPFCSGAISSSLFFCLMYLPSSHIPRWTTSLLSIKSLHFRAHFLVWLVALHRILSEQPFSFQALKSAPFAIDWKDSFLLEESNPEIPDTSFAQFWSAIRSELSLETVVLWAQQFSNVYEFAELMEGFSICEYVTDKVLAQ